MSILPELDPAGSSPAASVPAPGPAVHSADRIHDAELVRRFNAGDVDAFTEVVERHRKRILALALTLLKNPADAEDITQEALLRAYRGLGNFRGESSLATWLRRITYNLAFNRYGYDHRRCRHLTSSFDSVVHPQSHTTLGDLCVCPAFDPAVQSENHEWATRVDHCMSLLRPDQREILTLRTILERSYEQIAETLGLRLGTVKSRIARARTQLRALVEETLPTNEKPRWLILFDQQEARAQSARQASIAGQR